MRSCLTSLSATLIPVCNPLETHPSTTYSLESTIFIPSITNILTTISIVFSEMDQDEASPKGATRAWTEEEKTGLLLRVIIQLTTHGSIKWKEVHMPGRTAKSIEGQWTKVKTSLNTLKESMGLPVDVKSTPRKSPGMSRLSERSHGRVS
ncbi:hypothetical protein VHEMI03544 [[Torrubiella] hemipterigena]|uniref:Myb-like domain-containing protein n=1 Tax=[Torrubiella] hemipterigena TaxID=1531966 RepID=A0A0A1SSU3_9HYPO|nr:hypothetical protein VHEMI03544 [[Torrubiella] hemipterigena]